MSGIYELRGKRVYVAGHRGMVGSAIVRRLAATGCEVLTSERSTDLRDQAAVNAWFEANRPDAVFMAAARVGGILANDSYPAQFLYDNLMIEANVVEAARQAGVGKLLMLGSSCIYPRDAAQPIAEDALLTGPLEATNKWYAIAKIAGVMLCDAYRAEYGCDFISAMPTNLYGPGDNFDLETSHVLPALMRKTHEAKVAGDDAVVVWGSGKPRREFLHVDDLADACVFLMEHFSAAGQVNIGCGVDLEIGELARMIADVVGFEGRLEFDTSRPDGTMRKRLDVSKLSDLGWQARIGLREGIEEVYREFRSGEARQVRLGG
ncbi:GDP-L-fucose synthase family protein [Croceicoccus gelatinilyticus]|uniref:GDP-L-fucose synthase family protein n=1 Tax=Croceicoccus gelatinilyticus TaxID=2835536 RepID=UPI001BCD2AF8|nr:GDP-L-fucose synthase [Croceicoccus gelatinilyticus]MBS7669671.1 GDP-L-fucose synthase [Croceicoccus gelatinilyticus]